MKRSSLHLVWTLIVALATVGCAAAPALARGPCLAMGMSGSAPSAPLKDRLDAITGCAASCMVVAIGFEITLAPRRMAQASYPDFSPPDRVGALPPPSTPPPRVS